MIDNTCHTYHPYHRNTMFHPSRTWYSDRETITLGSNGRPVTRTGPRSTPDRKSQRTYLTHRRPTTGRPRVLRPGANFLGESESDRCLEKRKKTCRAVRVPARGVPFRRGVVVVRCYVYTAMIFNVTIIVVLFTIIVIIIIIVVDKHKGGKKSRRRRRRRAQ